jgi:glutathione peroxidase
MELILSINHSYPSYNQCWRGYSSAIALEIRAIAVPGRLRTGINLFGSSATNAKIISEASMNCSRLIVLALALLSQAALASPAPGAHKTVYDYALVGLDGKEVPLASYKGKVLLIVNLASKSIYKPQLHALEELQKAYADKGLLVVGIPSGDFGAQELADNTAIQHYYLDSEHVNFQVFGKATLRGKDSIPLVHLLTDPKDGAGGGEIHWNFTKFLVDRKGQPVLRYEADSDPSDPEFRVKLEEVLDGTFKKKESAGKDGAAPAGGDDDDDDGGE